MAFPATVYVAASNSSGIEDGSEINPFNTITEGMNMAVEGDGVLVSPGIYYGMIELKHNVQLISSDGPALTIIDAMGENYAAQYPYHISPTMYIEGFTLRNGIYALINASNRDSFWNSSRLEVHNSIFQNPDGETTQGISIYPGAAVTVTRSLFTDLPRGIYSIWCPRTTLKNITLDDVSSAFMMYQTSLSLDNVTVTNADFIIELWGSRGSGYVLGSNNNFFTYTDFSKPSWAGQYPVLNLLNSLEVDPVFVDTISDDYRLSSGSPLIDAGIDVGFPYMGSAPDIGAYEFDDISIPELIANLAESYQEVPLSAYKNVGENRRNALQNKFIAVLNMLDKIDDSMPSEEVVAILGEARNKIVKDIWAKSDGHFGGNPKNDWITTLEEQTRVQEKVTELLQVIDDELALLGVI